VRAKGNAALDCGFYSAQYDLASDISEADLLALVERLNADPAVHGILVQLPLPKTIRSARVLEAIAPHKDVDGFHPINVGLASIGRDAAGRCFPARRPGAMILIEQACAALGRDLSGQEAVIVGRSNIVGKPMAQLLLAQNCTVTIAHSRTRDLPGVARRAAQILVAAVGQPELVRGDWIAEGAIVIDVGVNRIAAEGLDAAGRPKTRLVGMSPMRKRPRGQGRSRPVPGGVGPMTIAMLMANTLIAACRANGNRRAEILSLSRLGLAKLFAGALGQMPAAPIADRGDDGDEAAAFAGQAIFDLRRNHAVVLAVDEPACRQRLQLAAQHARREFPWVACEPRNRPLRISP